MPIFERNSRRILFVHIPKTGGTSIENWVSNYASTIFLSEMPPLSLKVSPQHLQIRELKVLFGEKFWDWGFAVVRCPYERLKSEYFYRTETMFKQLGSRVDFSTWAIEHIGLAKKDPFYLDNHLRPQTDFIDTDIEIFRLEDGLEAVTKCLSDKLEIDGVIPIKCKNASYREPLKWSLDAINLVNDFYSRDFELLEYKKKSPKLKIFGRNR